MITRQKKFEELLSKVGIRPNINCTTSKKKVNFAIIKYWGKDDDQLMIPATGSLSISPVRFLGTEVKICPNDTSQLFINNVEYKCGSQEFDKCFSFTQLFQFPFELKIETYNNVNTANGLASSASAFAAICDAILGFFDKKFTEEEASVFARFGSISAARSMVDGDFVEIKKNGNKTFATKLEADFRLSFAIKIVSSVQKSISSRDAMKKVHAFPKEFHRWQNENQNDLEMMKEFIKLKEFKSIHKLIINNSEKLNQLMKATGVNYDQEDTVVIKKFIKKLNAEGLDISFTQDAGPNIKIISQDPAIILRNFPELEIF